MNKRSGVFFESQVLWTILIMACILSFIFGFLFAAKFHYPKDVSIPSSQMINNFCKSMDFERGWLSSSTCEVNEVQCHRNILDLDEYKCIKWDKDTG